MLRRAVEDMRNVAPVNDAVANRIDATVWLASASATPWFDAVGFDQRASLEHIHWCDEARKLLLGPKRHRQYHIAAKGNAKRRTFEPRVRKLSDAERLVLLEGLSKLDREKAA